MQITLLPSRRTLSFERPMQVAELLRKLDLLPGTVMVIRGDELVAEGDWIAAEDSVEIRNVISGG